MNKRFNTTRLLSSNCTPSVHAFFAPDSLISHRTSQHGEDSPEAADLYFAYGKALLENAISQTSVLGKDQTDQALPEEGTYHIASIHPLGLFMGHRSGQ